ncbi:glycosyltransferase family 4 protein, partial [Arthrobacter sp. PO-11]|nr:glycosyltransferase family 4 protein [Arthrobacter cavernae]
GGIRELAAALNEAGTLDRSGCRRAAATRFSANRMVSEHLRLYEEALTGLPAPADVRAPLDASSLV